MIFSSFFVQIERDPGWVFEALIKFKKFENDEIALNSVIRFDQSHNYCDD